MIVDAAWGGDGDRARGGALAARYIAAPVDLDGAAALVEALVLAPPRKPPNAARLADEARPIQATLAAGDRGVTLAFGPRRDPRLRPPRRRPAAHSPDGPAARSEAVTLLRAGLIVAVPPTRSTGSRQTSRSPTPSSACSQPSAARPRRPSRSSLADTDQAETLGILGPAARALGERFWPGGLTLVLQVCPVPRCRGCSPPERRPSACACRTTKRPGPSPASLGPLPTTSANVSGEPDARDARRSPRAWGMRLRW